MKKKIVFSILGVLCISLFACVLHTHNRLRMRNIVRHFENFYQKASFHDELNYKLYFMNLPLGYLKVKIGELQEQDKNIYKAHLRLRPWSFLSRISNHNIGLNMTSRIDRQSLLPLRYEQTDLYSLKKGKIKRILEYDHQALTISKKGHLEDIEEDTRDYPTWFLWLMSQDYTKRQPFKTTININKLIFLSVGKVKDSFEYETKKYKINVMKVKFDFLKMEQDYHVTKVLPATFFFNPKG